MTDTYPRVVGPTTTTAPVVVRGATAPTTGGLSSGTSIWFEGPPSIAKHKVVPADAIVIDRADPWFRMFAWRPLWTRDRGWVWLRPVWRRHVPPLDLPGIPTYWTWDNRVTRGTRR